MLSSAIENALNNQIREEAEASHYYLACASWCDKSGLPGSAKFLYQQSEEERQHMMKLFMYINDAGGHAIVPSIKQPGSDYKSLVSVFEEVLAHEISVTAAINKAVELSLAEKDFSTCNFLQWYVAEQHEEERLFRSILDMIKMIGLEGSGLYMIDREIEKKIRPANSN